MPEAINIMWFRRDLRLTDNAALYHALKDEKPVVPIFIFDRLILDKLEDKSDARVAFIHAALLEMQKQLVEMGSSLEVYYDNPIEVFKRLLEKYSVSAIYMNHDYEAYAKERDHQVHSLAAAAGAACKSYKDQVVFDKKEIVKDNGEVYTVFTPYSRKWLGTLNEFYTRAYPNEKYFRHFYKQDAVPIPSLPSMEFEDIAMQFPSKDLEEELVRHYGKTRDYPGQRGTSRLGVHFRFGTVSIRQAARISGPLNATYLNELIWRDFYQMILWNFPQVGEGKAFKPDYDRIQWRNVESEFEKWCTGQTGYPIVDAGMRELNETGFMHNRVRMVVASFLVKHLLIDWRWGEAYFAQKLLDFDLASNNGGWQWASGSGCDAAPYFRIFNPYLQTKKFDPDFTYIRTWVPEFEDFSYPPPMVEHTFARNRCLEAYKKALRGE